MDKKKFGKYIKEIRKNQNLTQMNVVETTGVSQETLRRVENGIAFVSFSTIEALSIFYKIDLFKIVSLCHEKEDIFSSFLDEISVSIKYGKIHSFKDQIIDFIKYLENNKSYESEFYIEYLNALLNFELITIRNGIESEGALIGLSTNNSNKYKHYITPFEISLNIYLSIILRINNNVNESINVLIDTKERVLNLPYSFSDKTHSLAVIAINLSTAYHKATDFSRAIEIIDEILSNKNMSFKTDDYFQLLFRKGVSLIKIKDDEFKKVLRTAFFLISNDSYTDLFTFYKNHMFTNYNISIEDL